MTILYILYISGQSKVNKLIQSVDVLIQNTLSWSEHRLNCIFRYSLPLKYIFSCSVLNSYLHSFGLFQDGLQDELSTYADEVFETPSEAALEQLDESELTGSALDKNELERSHLMLWVDIFYCIISKHI